MNDNEFLKYARAGNDCTVELQARLAAAHAVGGGEVWLPNGRAFYRFSDTLQIGPAPVSLVCSLGSELHYMGPSDCPAIRLNQVWGNRLQGWILRKLGDQKVGVGIDFAPDPLDPTPPPFGTCGGNQVWDQIGAFGFAIGAKIGNVATSHAASEITFLHCQFQANDVGVRLEDFNTLNMVFVNLGISGNRLGLDADTGGRVTILGGTASYNTDGEFRITHAHGFSVTGFRAEETNCFLSGPGTTAPSGVSIMQCEISQRANPTGAVVNISGGGRASIRDSWIGGSVSFIPNSGAGGILLENCAIRSSQPIYWLGNPQAPLWWISMRGCFQVDASNAFVKQFQDYTGYYGRDSDIKPLPTA